MVLDIFLFKSVKCCHLFSVEILPSVRLLESPEPIIGPDVIWFFAKIFSCVSFSSCRTVRDYLMFWVFVFITCQAYELNLPGLMCHCHPSAPPLPPPPPTWIVVKIMVEVRKGGRGLGRILVILKFQTAILNRNLHLGLLIRCEGEG